LRADFSCLKISLNKLNNTCSFIYKGFHIFFQVFLIYFQRHLNKKMQQVIFTFLFDIYFFEWQNKSVTEAVMVFPKHFQIEASNVGGTGDIRLVHE